MTPNDPQNSGHQEDPGQLEDFGNQEARRVWDALGAYPDEPVPEGFAARVMARVRSEGAVKPQTASSEAGSSQGGRPRRLVPTVSLLPIRGLAIAASLVAALGAGVLLSQRFLVREVVSVPAPTAALEAVPADLLDNEGLASLASLPDADFEALLLADADALDSN